MANYYTYGTIPNAEETVYGPLSQGYAEGGEVEEEAPNPKKSPSIFVEGADVPEGSGLNMGALDQLFANLRKTEELQKMALEPGLLQQGFTGATGAPSAPMGTGIRVPKAAPSGPAIDFDVTPEMAGALQAVARPAEITAAERAAVQENPRVQALSRISGLLEADDFRGAFDAALKAEQDLGGDFIGNLVDPNKMKMLRGPMDAQEITKFYNEMPQKVFEERYLGPGNEFKKEQAIERNVAALGGEAGYVDPTLGVKKEETLLGKLPIKELAALAAAAMGATAIPGLFGAGSASGAGAAGATTAGGTATATGFTPGLASAQMAASGAAGTGAATSGGFLTGLKTAATKLLSIPETLGIKIGEAFGANALSGVQAKMIGNAVISGGVTGAKGGDLEDILKSAALAAGLTYVSDKAIKTVAEGLRSTGTLDAAANAGKAISSGVEVVGEQAASNIAQNVVNGLDQFTVTFSPLSAAAQMASTVGALGGAQAATSVAEPTRQPPPEQQPTPEEQIAAEYTQTYERPDYFGSGLETGAYTGYKLASDKGVGAEPEREIKVTTEADKVAAEDVAAPLSSVVATQVVKPEGAFEEAPVVEGKPQITQQAPAQQPADIVSPVAIAASVPTVEKPFEEAPVVEGKPQITQQATPEKVDLGGLSSLVGTGYQVPKVNPITGELEVKVQASPLRPDTGKFDLSKLADVAALTPAILTEGYRDLPKEKSKTEKELDKIQADLAAASTTPSSSFLKDLIDKYGSVENALKLLGALGSAFSKAPKAPTGGAGSGTGGGMGGALPKYTYARQQLSPDIDYYTYGTRPEAKFFDYTAQLEKPVQPELPPAKTPDQESPVVSLAAPTYVGPTPLFVEPGMATGGLTGYAKGGSKSSRYVDGPGSGREDKIPALLSDGEYVIDAETLALLGDGSTKEGARRMDKFRANIRKHKGRALSRGRISPNAKSPDKYMGGGLT
jgi:hypothetical protein